MHPRVTMDLCLIMSMSKTSDHKIPVRISDIYFSNHELTLLHISPFPLILLADPRLSSVAHNSRHLQNLISELASNTNL